MRRVRTALAVAILAYSVIVTMGYSVSSPIDVDEHLFMASSFLVAQYGQHPYRDFAYFHMPNLVYLFAPFFLMPYSFMLARLFAGICAIGICLAIFLTARSLFANQDKLYNLLLPVCSTALLIHSPLFHYASSYAWNHTPSTLCAVLAFLLHCKAIRGHKPSRDFFLSGVSLGMAIGIRLSFFPLVVPFLLAIVVFRAGSVRNKGLNAMLFAVGGLLANLPAVYFLFTSYADFLFGNLGYAKLNTLYKQEMLVRRAMTFAGKMRELKDSVFAKPVELLILAVVLYSLVLLGINTMRSAARPRFEIVFLLLLLPFEYVGCMAPTPTWYQYYFAPVPFLILLSLYTLSDLRCSVFSEAAGLLLVVAAAISFIYSSPLKTGSMVRGFMKPESWPPVRLQREAANIRAYVDSRNGEGAVLTLYPLYAIESRLPIYKEFVTGPFAWRLSHLLSEEDAVNRGLPLRSRIKSFLEEKRPRAILTGKEEKQLEIPIIRAAQQLGYQPVVTPTSVVIWFPSK
jgi:4-amino-4-deoxy-L-arabinose transferase-like glycosyltransferase